MDEIKRFFKKIYGLDCLSIFLLLLTCIIDLVALLVKDNKWDWISLVALLPLLLCLLRTFSGNHEKRWEENHVFLSHLPSFTQTEAQKAEKAAKKAFRYFDCPACMTEIRVPKGKGKIEITCPKCSMKFVRKT